MSAYLFVFGTNYCGSTRQFFKQLMSLDLPFIYCPYHEKQTKEDYWKPVRKFYKKPGPLTFPSILLFKQINSDVLTASPLSQLDPVLDQNFEVEPWQAMESQIVLLKLADQKQNLRPILRRTFGCDNAAVKKMFHFTTSDKQAYQYFDANVSFVFCPIKKRLDL
jgi:hypothetical protein